MTEVNESTELRRWRQRMDECERRYAKISARSPAKVDIDIPAALLKQMAGMKDALAGIASAAWMIAVVVVVWWWRHS